jgi:chromosome segregation and condensation protein ScpB
LVTTQTFLNDLNIKKISDLPTLPEKEEIVSDPSDSASVNLEAS